MADNLIDLILSNLTGDTLNKLGTAVGANPQMAQAALNAGVPALLAGMLQKGSTTQGGGELLEALTRGNHDAVLGNLGGALGGGDSTASLMKSGASLLPMLFGNRSSAITDLLSNVSGLNKSSSNSMLSLLAPLAMGFVTRQLRGSGGLNLGSLTSLLGSQKGFLRNAAPAGLASALGLGSLDDLGTGVSRAPDTPAPKSDSGWLKWLVGLALLGVLFYALRNCAGPRETMEAPPPAPPPAVEVPAPGPVTPVPTGLMDLTLADGTTIQVAPDGVEARLVAFIQDASRPVDKDTWFTMDRMEFETGSASLRRSSDAQIDNIAAILRAYPNVKVKFGGYTDNTGDAATNLQLSSDRASNAAAAVVSRSVAADRVEAEGYGDQFPVADNATEEGQQRNRRIDVRVTIK